MIVTPASLLFRLRTREESAAWGRFVDLYTPLLFHWAQKLGEQDSDQADLVQDVFLILWRKLPEFEYDSGKSFHAWLKTIFMNRFRSRLRERKPLKPNSPLPSVSEGRLDDRIQELADEDDRSWLIRQAFRLIESEFSEVQQQIFREYVIEEQRPEQVASKLGLSPGTVYSTKSKILSRLRQELDQILD